MNSVIKGLNTAALVLCALAHLAVAEVSYNACSAVPIPTRRSVTPVRELQDMNPVEGMEFLVDRMAKTKSNERFLDSMKR